jgi:hypothetical protein
MNAFCIVQASYEISLLIFPILMNLLASAREDERILQSNFLL